MPAGRGSCTDIAARGAHGGPGNRLPASGPGPPLAGELEMRNPFFIGWLVLYVASASVLAGLYDYALAEIVAVLVIFGLLLPGLALLLTRGHSPRPPNVVAPVAETRIVLGCLVVVAVFIGPGLDWLHRAVTSPRADWFAVWGAKLALFVVLPYLLFRRNGYRWRDFFSFRLGRREWLVTLLLAAAFVLVNAVIGQGPERIASSRYGTDALLVGGLLVYVALVLEVGLVEEFFFRALLQARFAARFGSEISGLFLAATAFGLAHVPGFYLRWEQNAADLFPEPSLLFALAYGIAVISIAGLFMGVLWLRTRSLAVVMLVHAAGDWLPNVAGTLETWGWPR